MNLQINANLTVWFQANSDIHEVKKAYVQWKEMVKDGDGNWSLADTKQVPLTALVAEKEAFDTHVAKGLADREPDYVTAIANFYNN
jgi:hypothetical protein